MKIRDLWYPTQFQARSLTPVSGAVPAEHQRPAAGSTSTSTSSGTTAGGRFEREQPADPDRLVVGIGELEPEGAARATTADTAPCVSESARGLEAAAARRQAKLGAGHAHQSQRGLPSCSAARCVSAAQSARTCRLRSRWGSRPVSRGRPAAAGRGTGRRRCCWRTGSVGPAR